MQILGSCVLKLYVPLIVCLDVWHVGTDMVHTSTHAGRWLMVTIHQPLIHDTRSPCAGKDDSVKIEIATLGLQLNPSADNNAGPLPSRVTTNPRAVPGSANSRHVEKIR